MIIIIRQAQRGEIGRQFHRLFVVWRWEHRFGRHHHSAAVDGVIGFDLHADIFRFRHGEFFFAGGVVLWRRAAIFHHGVRVFRHYFRAAGSGLSIGHVGRAAEGGHRGKDNACNDFDCRSPEYC